MFRVEELLLSSANFESPLVHLHLRPLRWYGYIASKYDRRPWLSLVRCIIFTVLICVGVLVMLARVVQGYENPNDGVMGFATAIMFVSTSFSVVNAFVQRTRLIDMIRTVYEDTQKLMREADDQELELLLSTQKYIRKITLVLWIAFPCSLIIATLDCAYQMITLNETGRRLEEQSIFLLKVFPFREMYNNIVLGFLGTFYTVGMGVNIIPLWRSFIMCFMKYVQLKILILNKRVTEMDITRINPFIDPDRATPAQLTRWRMRLIREFVEEHVKIRRFVADIEQLVRFPFAIDVIIFSISICFEFYGLLSGTQNKVDYFFILCYIFLTAALLSFTYWHVTKMTESHEELCFAYYSTPWYEYELPMKKTILFMMMHAQKPLRIRAVLFEVDLATFLNILNGAYSYFNLLRGLS